MKFFYILIIYILPFIICYEALSYDVFDSDFIEVNIKTLNPNETKNISINNVKNISFLRLTDKILSNISKKKFNRIIETKISKDKLIKNIIIENEIITNEKYIAKIKINFNKEKIVKLLRSNKINYTDVKSEPFLVISSYNINFINVGLDKEKSFNNFLEFKANKRNDLIEYFFPNLDSNDRYILPYEKIINEDIKAFNEILKKYNLTQLFILKVFESSIGNQIDVNLMIYDNDKLENIGNLKFNNSNIKISHESFYYLSGEILFYMNDWWKNKYQINNSKFNIIECKILSENFNDLIKIKSKINNLSQVKYINTKKIKLNNNIVELLYYGDLNVLQKNLSTYVILYKKNDKCIIRIK